MTTAPGTPQVIFDRPPTTPNELWEVVRVMWGIELPRTAICDGHTSPFDAFCEGYFGNHGNYSLWYGSRGTGKSLMLAILGLTKTALLGINATLLGGSMAQSKNVHEHVENLMRAPYAPRHAVDKQIQTELSYLEGNWIRPLPASQRTVRGPHPQLVLLDEIDEMDYDVYTAAQGQAMAKPNTRGVMIPEMTIASSTWQNPIGTFKTVYDNAQRNGLSIHTWCWRETAKPHGWLDPAFIERKRLSVPAEMFRVEYELGEPAGDSRAFDLIKLNEAFIDLDVDDERHQHANDEWIFEKPDKEGLYAAGVDWAKSVDNTVIIINRIDVEPWRTVYVRIMNRRPWPYMIEQFNDVVTRYQAVSAHDATGLGNVVHDLVDERTMKVVMMGADRVKLLTDYITAVERGAYHLPRNIQAVYDAHRGTTVDEVFAPGKWNSHLADEVAAYAIAHRAATRIAAPAYGSVIKKDPKDEPLLGWQKHVNRRTDTSELLISRDGDVAEYIEESDTRVFWI